MKFIVKPAVPQAFAAWKLKENPASYDQLKGPVRLTLLAELLAEQGYLCAYTMLRINGDDDCHIEHIVPRWQDPGKQFDYFNMVACSPGRERHENSAFGAFKKGGKGISAADFVMPTSHNCEGQFDFLPNGLVEGGTEAAKATIKTLALNDSRLKARRADAVKMRELTSRLKSGRRAFQYEQHDNDLNNSRELNASEARQLAEDILRKNPQGKYTEFCVAIHQIANKYAESLASRAKVVGPKM